MCLTREGQLCEYLRQCPVGVRTRGLIFSSRARVGQFCGTPPANIGAAFADTSRALLWCPLPLWSSSLVPGVFDDPHSNPIYLAVFVDVCFVVEKNRLAKDPTICSCEYSSCEFRFRWSSLRCHETCEGCAEMGVERTACVPCHWGLRRSSPWGHDACEGCAEMGRGRR